MGHTAACLQLSRLPAKFQLPQVACTAGLHIYRGFSESLVCGKILPPATR